MKESNWSAPAKDLLSLVIILIFTFWLFASLEDIKRDQATSQQVDSLEQLITERLDDPTKWPSLKNLLNQ